MTWDYSTWALNRNINELHGKCENENIKFMKPLTEYDKFVVGNVILYHGFTTTPDVMRKGFTNITSVEKYCSSSEKCDSTQIKMHAQNLVSQILFLAKG